MSVKQYFELIKQKSEIEKQIKPLNESYKRSMSADNQTEFIEDGYKLELKEQDRSKMNNERLVALLKKKGYPTAIEIKLVAKEDVVETLVFEGKITPAELDSCIDKNIIKVLTVKEC